MDEEKLGKKYVEDEQETKEDQVRRNLKCADLSAEVVLLQDRQVINRSCWDSKFMSSLILVSNSSV